MSIKEVVSMKADKILCSDSEKTGSLKCKREKL